MKYLITILVTLLLVAGCDNIFQAMGDTYNSEESRRLREQQEQEFRDMQQWQHQQEVRQHHIRESWKD